MKRKVVIYPSTSRVIRSFGLTRDVIIELLAELHEGLPRKYDTLRQRRAKDPRKFLCRIVVPKKGGGGHLFVAVVDDSTSLDHLLVTDIGYSSP